MRRVLRCDDELGDAHPAGDGKWFRPEVDSITMTSPPVVCVDGAGRI